MTDTTLSARPVEEGHFTTHDGVRLFYRRWGSAAMPRHSGVPCRPNW